MKAFIGLSFLCMIGSSYQAEWTYEAENKWPGVCRSGSQQSPINIISRQAVVDRHQAHIRGPLVFRGYQNVVVAALNNGHTLKWNGVEGVPPPTLSGGPLRGNYSFIQFHLHWLSEHAIDGYKYPLEIHMVHRKTELSLEEALQRPDGLAVVGVLCVVKSGPEAETALEELMPVVPDLIHHVENQTSPKFIDMTRLLSPDPQSFYTYHGSLTTPQCQEVVTWIVMDKPLTISDTQYKLFSKVDVGGINNYRGLHPTNRIVYRSMASCANIFSPSLLGFFIGVLTCTKSSLIAAVAQGICEMLEVKRKLFGNDVQTCSRLVN